eukprot:scaffold2200_cov413-Prasinococcus_capsulatus_cf.AAC.13
MNSGPSLLTSFIWAKRSHKIVILARCRSSSSQARTLAVGLRAYKRCPEHGSLEAAAIVASCIEEQCIPPLPPCERS